LLVKKKQSPDGGYGGGKKVNQMGEPDMGVRNKAGQGVAFPSRKVEAIRQCIVPMELDHCNDG